MANTVLQAAIEGPAGTTFAARTQFYDNPHRPPPSDPNLLSVGDHAPDIFRFDDSRGEGFHPVLLLKGNDPMDIDVNLNKATKVPPGSRGAYAGGMDFQGALARRIRNDLRVTTRTQAPNTILTLGQTNDQTPGVGSVRGASRIPTSPLPLFGPRFPANGHSLLPPIPDTWSLDLFPASSFNEVAGLTIPTSSIGMVDPEAGGNEPKHCEELLEDNSRCSKVAVAQCVDRYVS